MPSGHDGLVILFGPSHDVQRNGVWNSEMHNIGIKLFDCLLQLGGERSAKAVTLLLFSKWDSDRGY